jgi:hypothetical protein
MINPNSQYQGFTGSNYDEDDLERAKAGGFVRFNGDIRNSVLQNIISDPNSIGSKNTLNILSSPEMQAQENKKLTDIHNRMINRDNRRTSILNKAASENPGIDSDLKNQRMDHFEEFMNAYPEYKKLMDEGEEDRDYYMNSPLGTQHMKGLIEKEGEKAIRGHDFKDDDFQEIMEYLKKFNKPKELNNGI